MTIQRMIELLEIEHECMLRGAHDDCDRNCADCELVQDDGDLHEMYTNVIALLKKQEAVKPIPYHRSDGTIFKYECRKCRTKIFKMDLFCRRCGHAVKWND